MGRLLHEKALAHSQLGQLEEAKSAYERSLEIREQTLGADHPDLARTLDELGVVLLRNSDFADAQRHLERSVAIQEKRGKSLELGLSLNHLGEAYAAQRKLGEAERALRKSLDIVERELPTSDPRRAVTQQRYERVRKAIP